MNPSDSKKLEENKARYSVDIPGGDVAWLISKVKEQDREIERLREELDMTAYALDHAPEVAEVDYQRRHQKWAIERMRIHAFGERYWSAVAGDFVHRAEKAEAELAECHGRLMAYRDSTTELIAS